MRFVPALCLACAVTLLSGCSSKEKPSAPAAASTPAPTYYKVDPATAGAVTGVVHFNGPLPARKPIDMSNDPACVEAHHGKAYDESLIVHKGAVANAFIYIQKGLEGKTFEAPATPVTIEQSGCWFRPRVFGIQTGQVLKVVNSDPVTHNIHPMAQINREWNHSQGPGDAPLIRRFLKPEVMIQVKCNIHSWMHAFIGAVDNPYYAVTTEDGTFSLSDLPAGTYTLAIWQEKLGTQTQQITVTPHSTTRADFTFKGK